MTVGESETIATISANSAIHLEYSYILRPFTSKFCVIIASNSRFNLPILAGAVLCQWQAIALPDCCLARAVSLITIR
jgi:hypothetical protein